MPTTPYTGKNTVGKPGSSSTSSPDQVSNRSTPTAPVADTTPFKPTHTAMPSSPPRFDGTQVEKTLQQRNHDSSTPLDTTGSSDTTRSRFNVSDDRPDLESRDQPGQKRLSDYVKEFYEQDNPVNRLAAQYGQETATARGLPNSSVAIGTAQENVLRRADALGSLEFQQDRQMQRHNDQEQRLWADLKSQDAVRQANIQKTLSEIDNSVYTGVDADGKEMTLTAGQTKAMRAEVRATQNTWQQAILQIQNNNQLTGDDKQAAIADQNHIYQGRMMGIGATYGVDLLRHSRSFNPPSGTDWNSPPPELVSGWARDGMTPRAMENAARYAQDNGFIDDNQRLAIVQEIQASLDQTNGYYYNAREQGRAAQEQASSEINPDTGRPDGDSHGDDLRNEPMGRQREANRAAFGRQYESERDAGRDPGEDNFGNDYRDGWSGP